MKYRSGKRKTSAGSTNFHLIIKGSTMGCYVNDVIPVRNFCFPI